MMRPASSAPICTSCGVVAPVERKTCEGCHARLPEDPRRRAHATPLGEVYWAAIRASFTCRSCGFASPFDGVETGEGTVCVQCGSYQRFDDEVWPAALAFAHTVADLGGPQAEGRFAHPELWIGDDNPYATIGRTRTFASHAREHFQLQVSPGFPVCKSCKVLLQVHAEGPILTTSCRSCNTTARFATEADVMRLAPGIAAVCAEAHRKDLREVQMTETAAGLQVLSCPGCGANLPPVNEHTVSCTYCHTTAFVPARGRVRGKGHIVRPIIFWIAFRGPSAARLELAAPGGALSATADLDDEHDLADPLAPTDLEAIVTALEHGRQVSIERSQARKLTIKKGTAKPTGSLAKMQETMGLALPGIEMLPKKSGPDPVQIVASVAATAAAVGLGYLVALMVWL